MRKLRVSQLTREFLNEPVALTPGSAGVITDCPVWMAIVPIRAEPSTWTTAAWYTQPDGLTVARVLLGDDIELAVGVFDAYVRVDLGDEQPVRLFAHLYVT